MEGAYLKLVKDIPKTFQNSYFICGSLFGIFRSVRLQKIFSNHQDGWGLHTPLETNVLLHQERLEKLKFLVISVIWTRHRHIDTEKYYTNEIPNQASELNRMELRFLNSTNDIISGEMGKISPGQDEVSEEIEPETK